VGFVALFLLLLGLAANDLEAAPLLLLLLLVGFVVLLFSLYRCRLELKAPPIGSPLDFGAPVIVLVGTPTALVLAVADGRPTCCCESTRAFLRRGDLVCWPWKGFFLLRLLLLVCLFLFPVLWFVLVLVLVLGACAATAAVARLASGVVLLMVVAVLCCVVGVGVVVVFIMRLWLLPPLAFHPVFSKLTAGTPRNRNLSPRNTQGKWTFLRGDPGIESIINSTFR
jgi:hypothetical protein